MTRRYRTLVIAAVVLAVGGWWAFRAYRRAELRREFAAAMQNVRDRARRREFQQLAGKLSRDPALHWHGEVLKGSILLSSGDSAAAYRVLSAVPSAPELRAHLLLLLGECLYHQGDLTEAERAFRQAAIDQPDRLEPHRWLATIYHDIGAVYGALAELKEVVRIVPDNYFAYALMGQLYIKDLERPKEAEAEFRSALERDPPADRVEFIRRELAHAQISLNDYSGALETLADSPPDPGVLAMRAECQWSLGELEAARAALDEARRLDPENHAALLLEARMLIERREAREAVKMLERIVSQDPNDVPARYQLAIAYRLAGDADRSQAELDRMQRARDQRMRLRELYEKAMHRPTDVALREEIVEACEELGNQALADVWRKALKAARDARRLKVEAGSGDSDARGSSSPEDSTP